MAGKCPGCGKSVTSAVIENVSVSTGKLGATTWKGVSYVCPNLQCQTILGVSIDPVALKTDIVKEIGKLLRGK